MSQCRAPDCPSKNYTECKTRENAGTCSVSGTVPPNSAADAGCTTKSSGDSTWNRNSSECPSGITDQNTCEKVQGCEWTYESPSATTLNHIRKVCKPEKTPARCTASDPTNAANVSTCNAITGEALVNENACASLVDAAMAQLCTYTPTGIKEFTCDDNFTPNKGRYNLIEPDTFGCDRKKCDYLSQKKALVPGICRGSGGCSGNDLQACADDALCTWESNDEGYCGYNRNIEYALEKENKAGHLRGAEITEITLNETEDPCLRIQNPGRQACELEGCIWDIYGNRTTPPNIYNSNNGTLIDNYYDISTTGLCKMPKTENCMDYFCSRQSGDSIGNINFNLPDGRCENTSGSCTSSEKEIVAIKTPGLITYLPENFPTQTDSSTISRDWYDSDNENYEIRDVNLLLGLKYNKNLAKVRDKENIPNMFQEIYKDNCEYNMTFPMTTNDDDIQYKYEKRKTIYDYDSDLCINEKGVALPTDPIPGNAATASFYGNCRDQTFYHKDSGQAVAYVNAGDISDKNRCSIQIKQPIVDLFVDNGSLRSNTQTSRKNSFATLTSSGTCSIPTNADMSACSTDTSLWTSDLKHSIYNTQHSTNYSEAPATITYANLTADLGVSVKNVPIDILEKTQRNVECRTKFYEIVGILKGLIGPGTDGLKQIKGMIGTGTTSISPDDNYNGFSIAGTGYYPKTTVGVGELYNHIRVKINGASYGAPIKAALQGLFGDTPDLESDTTALSFSNISETPVNINNSVLYGVGTCSDGTSSTPSICIAAGVWTPDTSNIILSISKKHQLEYISEEEYSSEVARYLASLVVYEETCELKPGQSEPSNADCNTLDSTACATATECQLREWNDGNTNSLSCIYDPYGQEYIYHKDGQNSSCTVLQTVIDACTTIGDSDTSSTGTVGADCNADPNCVFDNSAATSVCREDTTVVASCTTRDGNRIAPQVITAAAAGVITTDNSGTGQDGFAVGDSVVVTSLTSACGIEGAYTLTGVAASSITVAPPASSPVDGFNGTLVDVNDCRVERLVSGSCTGVPECGYNYAIPTHNNDFYMYQKLAEVLPVSLDSDDYLIGTGSAANPIENISTKHRIKDIIYKPGKAIVTLQYQTPSGVVAETNTLSDLTSGSDIENIRLGSIAQAVPTTIAGTLIFNHLSAPGNASVEALRFNKLFDGTTDYTYDNKSFKNYIGGIVEIEIDGVDPGCFGADGMDTEGFCIRSGEIFTLPDDVKFVVSNGTKEWMIKEVRLKDVPVDIYFEGDIDGLYKANDIISIDGGTGVINEIFNPNLKLTDEASSGKYQQITEVDIVNNKITVENTRRRGKYFINRGALEEYHYEADPKNCVKSTGTATADDTLNLTNQNIIAEKCDLKNDLYDKCRIITDSALCGTDSRCEWLGGICQPIGIATIFSGRDGQSGLGDSNTQLKCNESIGNKDYLMEKTVCPTEITSGAYNRRYEDMIRMSSTGATGATVGSNITLILVVDSKYDITDVISDIITNISPTLSLSESGILEDWRIRYLYWDNSNTRLDIGEGRIINHEYTTGVGTHKIKIQRNTDGPESNKIYPLSIKPPNIDQLKLGNHTDLPDSISGDAGNSFDITINNYVRKTVSDLQPGTPLCTGVATNPAATPDCTAAFAGASDTTTASCPAGCTYRGTYPSLTNNDIKIDSADSKRECDFYNGIWDYASCNGVNQKNIRASDLCEKTGFIFDEESNLCYKEKNVSDDNQYCSNKTSNTNEQVNWDNHNSGSDEEKYPCSVCKWINAGKKCEELPRRDCTSLDINNCGINSANHNRPGTSSVPSSCEYYRHNMDSITIEIDGTDLEMRQSDFMCSESDDVSATSATCSAHQTLETCEPGQDPTGCEWQCPLAQGEEHPGYKITLASDQSTLPQTTVLGLVESIHYFSPGGIHVECDADAGYEVIPGDSTLPKAQCIRNSDASTVGNHSEILGFVGCVKRLNCQNTEFTLEKIQTMFSNDASSVPSNFITDGELDQTKFPDINGNFKCPSPAIIIDNPDTVTGWDEDTCCINVGLCTGNDIGPNIICPEGQEIIMKYYEGNPNLSSHVGTTPEECCEAPPVPTITIPLDADYKELVDYDDGITFKKDFTTDIVRILNDTENENNDLSFTITEDMIEIVYIEEGSVIVTFKINKDIDGKVVLKNQLQRILTTGTYFRDVGVSTKGEPNFKEHDPADKYLFYLRGYGMTTEVTIISIIITISLCFFCLVVIGMLMK